MLNFHFNTVDTDWWIFNWNNYMFLVNVFTCYHLVVNLKVWSRVKVFPKRFFVGNSRMAWAEVNRAVWTIVYKVQCYNFGFWKWFVSFAVRWLSDSNGHRPLISQFWSVGKVGLFSLVRWWIVIIFLASRL